MALILVNNTASDITFRGTNITLLASGTYVVQGTQREALIKSEDFYDRMSDRSIVVNNGAVNVPNATGMAIARNFDDPSATKVPWELQVAAGDVPGWDPFYANGYVTGLETSGYKDVWMGSTNLVVPTTNESYQIRSTNAADTAAGTGARTVLVTSIGTDGNEQSQVVALNGTTAVPLTGLHSFPMGGMFCLTFGSGHQNAGDIILETTGGVLRNQITATEGNALAAIFKIPMNRVLYPRSLDFHTGGAAKPVDVRIRIWLPGSNGWISNGHIPFIESSFGTIFPATFQFEPGTIVKYEAKLASGASGTTAVILGSHRKTVVV